MRRVVVQVVHWRTCVCALRNCVFRSWIAQLMVRGEENAQVESPKFAHHSIVRGFIVTKEKCGTRTVDERVRKEESTFINLHHAPFIPDHPMKTTASGVSLNHR